MKKAGSENKPSALEMPSSLIHFPSFFQQTFIQYYKTQFGYRKDVNITEGKQLLVWNFGGNLDSGPMPFLNTVTRMGSRCAQLPRASDGGRRKGSLCHPPASED